MINGSVSTPAAIPTMLPDQAASMEYITYFRIIEPFE